jgi:CDP-glycerol glycerophosphotransferase (TagB/SpsB family)
VSYIADAQQLLVVADAFVTDISSMALDYLYFSGNLYTFFPDKNEYLKDRGGVYEVSMDVLTKYSRDIECLNEVDWKSTSNIAPLTIKEPYKYLLELL